MTEVASQTALCYQKMKPSMPTTPDTTPPFSPRHFTDSAQFVIPINQQNQFSSVVVASLSVPGNFGGNSQFLTGVAVCADNRPKQKRATKRKPLSSHTSRRRRRRKIQKSAEVKRSLNGYALQQLMATHYPDKIYGLNIAPGYNSAALVKRIDAHMDDWLELTVEWGALLHAPAPRTATGRKRAVETIKTILPYSLMKKHYPEVLIWFYEERLRLYMPPSADETDCSSTSSSPPASDDTNDSRE